MIELYEQLPSLLKTFWLIAIFSSLIFIVQSIMTFFVGDVTDGLDADFEGDLEGNDGPFQLFSFRNLINFLLGFSWGGISFYDKISNSTLLIFISFLIGLAFLFLFFVIIKQVQKLAEDNSFKLEMTLNKTAEVYLKIPANKNGFGKIHVSVNGSLHELQAITENEVEIEHGKLVTIISIEDNQYVKVKPL
jgi:hypothetical protein